MDMDARDDRCRTARFLASLEALRPTLERLSDEDDALGRPPEAALAALRGIGALAAPLPVEEGGCGLGCVTQGGETPRFLRLLGQCGIALGRLLEGHVNALRLVWLFGSASQRARAAGDACGGKLFGIWVTEAPGRELALVRDARGLVLEGGKAFCSGAGFVDRALVTAYDAGRDPAAGGAAVMLLVTPGTRVGASRAMSGVRAAMTADMALSGIAVSDEDRLGSPGDYLRPPEFASGAWRGSAVALGGLEALTGEARAQLVARGRHENPHQAARIGRMLIACETARLWVERAARGIDHVGGPAGDLADRQADSAALVNLARIAVETACLDAMVEVQRALGLAGFARANRVERLLRDLSTYLRQPAPDETLTEAAIRFADRPLPPDLGGLAG